MIEIEQQFKADANVMPMMEKMIMQIMAKNGLLTGNKTFGVVEEILNHSTLMVNMQQSGLSEMVNCTPAISFKLGDRVLVEYINNNPHDRFVLGVLKGGYEIDQMDYSQLPDEPVEIVRNTDGLAYKFIYGYNNPRTTWTQELIRSEETGKVTEIIYSYPDGFVMSRALINDNLERLHKYE